MAWFRYSLCVVLLVGTAACSGSQSASESVVSAGQSGAEAPGVVAVDVPTLVGLSIDEVRQKLGKPRESSDQKVGSEPTPEQLKTTKGEGWINTFEHSNTTLVVTFNARTRRVRDLVVVGTNEEELLQKANLRLTASNYLVLPVANPQNESEIVGVRVIKK